MFKRISLCSVALIVSFTIFNKFNLTGVEAKNKEVNYKSFGEEIVLSDYSGNQWGLNNNGTLRYNSKVYGTNFNHDISVRAVDNIDIDFSEARALYKGGKKKVVVAVIDTGIDIDNIEIRDAIWKNEKEIPYNGVDDDNNGYIDDINGWNFYDDNNVVYTGENDTHGTHIAGTIVAKVNNYGVSGVAGSSPVELMVLKALGGEGEDGYTDNIIKAIKYAEDNGATICNFSFGTEKVDNELAKVIKNSKMLFVVAAGNGDKGTGVGYNIETRPMYPATYDFPNLIKVANLQADGYLNITSNFSDKLVDLAAPGSMILGIVDNNRFLREHSEGKLKTPYAYLSGTSMAAPMVAGTAALIASDYPNLNIYEIKKAILGGVKKLSSLEGRVSTGGMLSAKGALEYCISNYTVPVETSSEDGKNIDSKNKQPDKDKKATNVKKSFKRKKAGKTKKLIKSNKNSVSFKKGNVKVSFNIEKSGKILLKLKGKANIGYVSGNKKLSYFKKSDKWSEINLNSKKQKLLNLKKGRTYTFYIVDSKGKKYIKQLTIKG